MRTLLLLLSRSKTVRRFMETSPLARRFASRFVAGETLASALAAAGRLRSEGVLATLDRLGENITSAGEAAAARDEYLDTLERLAAAGIEGNVSIKPTQFGMDISESLCRENAGQLVRKAAELGAFVRVDMESSAYTDRTLNLVTDLHVRCGAVGAVIQASLYRSRRDVEMLCGKGIRVRLCKGAYLESAKVAFPRKADVDRNFLALVEILLSSGIYHAIATHDERMIAAAQAFASARGIPPDRFEFQMLHGVRRHLQARLVAAGYRLRVYVPFGAAWYPYFMRRLAERPANVLFLLRNVLRN